MASAKFQGPKEWDEWTCWLVAGLHGREPWRLSVLLMGILFAQGRRTVSTWLRAAGVSPDYVDCYYFLASVGRNAKLVSWRLLSLVLKIVPLPQRVLLVLDDTPTQRYGPQVEGADVHHNPTPGHAGAGRPEIPLRPRVGHAVAGRAAFGLWRAGIAAAGHAAGAAADAGVDSAVAGLEVSHEAGAGGQVGRVGRLGAESRGKNGVGGSRTKRFGHTSAKQVDRQLSRRLDNDLRWPHG
jgi:hypothetical protein